MAVLTYAGDNFGPTLADTLDEIRLHAFIPDFTHLGDDATERNTRGAQMLNRAIAEFYERNVALGFKTASLSMVAGTNNYSIASNISDLHVAEILRIEYTASTDPGNIRNKPLEYLDRGRILQLPPEWRNDTVRSSYPMKWGFDDDASDILFFPYPASARTLTVTYRQEWTPITANEFGTPGSVQLEQIPTQFQRFIALYAASLIIQGQNPQRADMLMSMADAEMGRARTRFAEKMAALQRGTGAESRPNAIVNRSALFRDMQSHRTRIGVIR